MTTTHDDAFDFARASTADLPFRHLVCEALLPDADARALAAWLNEDARWKDESKPGFYSLQNISLHDHALPQRFGYLLDAAFLARLRDEVGARLGIVADGTIRVTAHRMREGDKIGIHTDEGAVPHAFRLLVQLNPGWTFDDGGLLFFFESDKPQGLSPRDRIFQPKNGLGIAFPITKNSFHAVSRVARGTRTTLCFSFNHAVPNAPTTRTPEAHANA